MYIILRDKNIICSNAAEPAADGKFELSWTPKCAETIEALGIEISSQGSCKGKALIDFISISGISEFISETEDTDFSAWISNMAASRFHSFSSDEFPGMRYLISNEEPGVHIIGNRTWGDTRLSVQFKIHSADHAGLLVHYQGLCRWIGVIFSRHALRIVRNYYGEEILAEADFVYRENELMQLDVRTCQNHIEVFVDDKLVLTAEDEVLRSGGAGIYVDHGCAGFGRFAVEADIVSAW